MATEVVMPQMGESIAEGTITKWMKNVGDHVDRDEPLFEISTDKVDAEIPSPAAGTLTEIKFKEGETVEVNTVVAVLDGDGAKPSVSQEVSAPPPTETAPPEKTEVAPEPPTPETEASATVERPKPTITTEERGAPKTAPSATIHKTEVKPLVKKSEPSNLPPTPAVTHHAAESATASAEDLRRTKSSPLVRRIAEEHGIDIKQLEGTGMSGRVTKNDILSFIESGAPAPQRAPVAPPSSPVAPSSASTLGAPGTQQIPAMKPGEGDRVEQMSVMRKKIAEHMVLSRRTSAHVTTVYEVDMSKIAKLRDDNRDSFLERTGTKLTYMPFIFKAVTDAIRKFPVFNSQVTGDQIIYKRDINLGMAVALDWGLIVPVIKRADDLSISGLARAANDLADRARSKQLKPDEVAGGTFTITNPGVFGGLFGTPIINQPQVAILGVGKIEKRAKVLTTSDGEDYIAIRHLAYFALSFDHRIIDGADAERFLAYIKEHLESGQFAF
jgi:pyruvate dehydrogenase E2 component (dihydrolipoamide acetyltransferase)